jgi:hypothetical protein
MVATGVREVDEGEKEGEQVGIYRGQSQTSRVVYYARDLERCGEGSPATVLAPTITATSRHRSEALHFIVYERLHRRFQSRVQVHAKHSKLYLPLLARLYFSLLKRPTAISASMADVRSLLRSELASRGSSAQAGTAGRITKKRKIDSTDDPIRKRSRPAGPISDEQPREAQPGNSDTSELLDNDAFERDALENEEAGPELPSDEDRPEASAAAADSLTARLPDQDMTPTLSASSKPQEIDEDEWAAFEREVATPARAPQVPAAALAAATISAAPVSAEELAAQQQREKQELLRAREEDAEGEKEDAARLLEEEFDEMEQLEERVKRLKEKREELRRQNATGEDESANGSVVEPERAQNITQQDGYESEEEDEGDEDWDDWRFR